LAKRKKWTEEERETVREVVETMCGYATRDEMVEKIQKKLPHRSFGSIIGKVARTIEQKKKEEETFQKGKTTVKPSKEEEATTLTLSEHLGKAIDMIYGLVEELEAAQREAKTLEDWAAQTLKMKEKLKYQVENGVVTKVEKEEK